MPGSLLAVTPPAPAASVVVPTHRGAHRLGPLFLALEAQDLAQPWEVVVVIDGRDAETEAMVDAYRDRLPLHTVLREVSTGVAGALNAGYDAARGRVVVRCDDDLTPAPDMLRRHLDHHATGELVGVIGPTRDVLADTAYARAYGRAANERALASAYSRPASTRWVGWAAHNSVARECWATVGGFDESYSYREDSDFGLRLTRAGVTLLVDPALELEHRGAANDTRTRAARAWVSGASEVLFAQRHPQVAATLTAPPAGGRQRVWHTSVTALARAVRTRESAARLGAVVDRALPRMPLPVARRIVAAVVEASAASGRLHGSSDQEAYREQKAEELRTERPQR